MSHAPASMMSMRETRIVGTQNHGTAASSIAKPSKRKVVLQLATTSQDSQRCIIRGSGGVDSGSFRSFGPSMSVNTRRKSRRNS